MSRRRRRRGSGEAGGPVSYGWERQVHYDQPSGPPAPRPARLRRAPARPASLALVGFLGGLTVGVLAWAGALRVSRRELFSPSPLRRFAALTYLGGNPSASSARLLRDYVRWETRPVLRRHGERLLRRAEHHLG